MNDIKDAAVNAGIKKANFSALNQFILGILAGAFIAFGSQAANMISHAINNPALAKFIAGLIFPAGLILVVLAGAELFTGNCLMIMALLEKKITLKKLLRSWIIVYIGNLLGGIFIAFLISKSGQLNNELLKEFTIKAAKNKISLSFCNAFILGLLCNWLVCLAVWLTFGASDTSGKILAIFFPIWLFVASGFEHSVANMYYIPAGIFAEGEGLTWTAMFIKNLLPVTLGNIVGGAIFVGFIYWLVNKKHL
ncbi:MAG: formate/nitrite transporter family protein [Synergistales bacterium]|nr:formate/nitrite transporter family protein [Synergistales bacterium]MDY6401453.1 formate/nitrite transporter family protein [Synergistales bacterium]MDY6404087.1 formate/nitrite transporter family protein [Synergistales bacterium]MDY6409996.1 formate/nitrite transporter family protein [Synergistales bacterium]MDY6414114.1 formate/nitrite transporter family protein [Synergistales bacterium]